MTRLPLTSSCPSRLVGDAASTSRRAGHAVLGALIIVLMGCAGVEGDSNIASITQQRTADPTWLVIDLTSGTVQPRTVIPDLATNPHYRSDQLVVRQVYAHSTTIGSAAGARWSQTDAPQSRVDVPRYYIAAFELTRAQWRHLASTTPWTAVVPASLAGGREETLPVCGVSLDQVQAMCAAWTHGGHFAVPTGVQWECACRADSTTLFSWGDQIDDATVARFAVVRSNTTTPTDGPKPVGTLERNALGLYDMHGNVWEWTTDSGLRGGSWHDGLPLARSANQLSVDRATPYGLAGVRLVYVP